MSTQQPILEARGLVKRFGHVVALDGADLELYPKEILAIIGDNGAGKSTLIKALSGALRPDEGEIRLDGERAHFHSPRDARRAGIETVYQDLAVAPSLDIASNIFLGREVRRRGPQGGLLRMLNKGAMRREATRHFAELQIGVQSMTQPVENLSGGQRQGVAVARAATWAERLVIMDEPTAALGVKETGQVLDLIRRVRERGLPVILISHDMPNVFALADRILIMRLGRRVAVVTPAHSLHAGSGRDHDGRGIGAAVRRGASTRRPSSRFPPHSSRPEQERTMTFVPAADRYERMPYNRCGRSGVRLPAVSLGLWHNFGHERPLDTQRAILRRAFDLGVTHIDLANNYGPPFGSAEENFGKLLGDDLAPFRDELVISTKAGYDMWPGPYGEWGSRKYLLASLDQSLRRMGLDYVDVFYSHRFDPETPLEETMGALDSAVRQGKALYVGISSYSAEKTREAAAILRDLGTPLLIHQPSYSMLNRWIEDGLLDALGELGVGCIAFSPLAQGMLTDKYLHGIPEGSRATENSTLSPKLLSDETLAKVTALNEIAAQRGQSLAQMALAWTLRDPRVTSAVIGASSVPQLEANIVALDKLDFTPEELSEIDRHATESGINLWAASSSS